MIISNELNIEFPELWDNSKPEMPYKKFLEYEAHLHISSGSIFKLNSQFKKDWEIILKDKRVEQISSYDSTTFIAAGDNIRMRKMWVARINIADGKMIWLKEFAVRHESTVSCLCVSFKKDILILSENKRLIPLDIRMKYGRKRILFFEKASDFEYLLSLSRLSGNGELNWTKTVDFKNRYNFESYGMAADTNIHLLSWFSGFDKVQGKYIKHEGENGYTYNLKGDQLVKKSLGNNREAISIYENGWIFVNKRSDSISIEKLDDKMRTISYRVIKTPQKYSRIQALSLINGAYYLYGYTDIKTANFLICKLDTTFRLLNSWVYKRTDWNDDIRLAPDAQGLLTILGKCYTKPDGNRLYQYINLVKLNLN
ncbi:hypothetical protein GALL_507150 [mine drainage metagenome]|uniref:Uncharacterized protein n=1 Tax=mine drainage metagenome TaxID=410659 RepID=A0A1J5PAF8_9ZZZZ